MKKNNNFLKKLYNAYLDLFAKRNKGIRLFGKCVKHISKKSNVHINGFFNFNMDFHRSDYKKSLEIGRIELSAYSNVIINGSLIARPGCKLFVYGKGTFSVNGNSGINYNTTISCSDSIIIGNNVQISQNCVIRDCDMHYIGDKCNHAPIKIEDNVLIGTNVIILKGVTIGEGSIIGAGSVVVKSIPAHSLAVGNPAKPIKNNVIWK